MTIAVDYANAFETEFRAQRRVMRSLRYALVLAVWVGLFLVRPRLALEIWRERRGA
jgi:hypothetical protein